jgi:hypothetical protein
MPSGCGCLDALFLTRKDAGPVVAWKLLTSPCGHLGGCGPLGIDSLNGRKKHEIPESHGDKQARERIHPR